MPRWQPVTTPGPVLSRRRGNASAQLHRRTGVPACPLRIENPGLKRGHFREVETAYLHGRHDHIEDLLARRAHTWRKSVHIRKQLDQILIETEISQSPYDLPIFNQKR